MGHSKSYCDVLVPQILWPCMEKKKKLILFYWTVIEFSGISTLVLLQRRERYRWCVRHVGSLMIAELTFCASG